MFKYRLHEKYKYQVADTFSTFINIYPKSDIKTPWIELSKQGVLTIKKGYCWDGATGAIDTETFMRGSLFHDALYQLMHDKYLPYSYRKKADKLLYDVCREDGMSWFRARYVYAAVRMFGKIVMNLRSK